MFKGTVKWFNDKKGFGFIVPEAGGNDIFVYFKDIVAEGYKTLAEGDKVSYDIKKNPDGRDAAANVKKIS